MELAEPEVRSILLEESDDFRALAEQHAEFESRLSGSSESLKSPISA